MNFSPIETDPRRLAITNRGRQVANEYIEPSMRHSYSRTIETFLTRILSGDTLTAGELASIDRMFQAYLYLADVRTELSRLLNNPSLTVNDFVEPDPNADRPYTRATIWAGAPWLIARTNRPLSPTDYSLAETDLGVVLTQPNTTCTGPAYSSRQDSWEYDVTNASQGTTIFQPANGEYILFGNQPMTAISIPPAENRHLGRESTSHRWIIL